MEKRLVLVGIAALGVGLLVRLPFEAAVEPALPQARPSEHSDGSERLVPLRAEPRVAARSPHSDVPPAWDRFPVTSADTDSLLTTALEAKDSTRLLVVNAALEAAGLERIDSNCRISLDDLAAFRVIVDHAEKRVDQSETNWLRAATDATAPLVTDLADRLARGDVTNLPLMNRHNNLTRRHPHEAVAQVIYGNTNYVVRVLPQQNQELAACGLAVADESARRVSDYNTLVRSLFATSH